MRKKLIESAIIIGGLVISLVSNFISGANMNALSWILTALGSGLVLGGVIFSIFSRDKVLSPRDYVALFEDRKKYLPELKSTIELKIARHEYLMNKASKCSFEDYGKKYFWNNKKYKDSMKKHPNNINFAYQIGFWATGFIGDNLLYKDLIKADDTLSEIESKYKLLYSHIKDKKLKKLLNNYWYFDRVANSGWIFEEMMKNSKQKITIPKRRLMSIGFDTQGNFKSRRLSMVIERIDELLDGVEDE